MKRSPFTRTLNGVGPASGSAVMRDQRPARGVRLVYTIIRVLDATTANSDFDVGVGRAGTFTPLVSIYNLAAGVPQYHATAPIVVEGDSDEQLEVRVAGAGSGDVLSVTLHGYAESWKE